MKYKLLFLFAMLLMETSAQAQPAWNFNQIMQAAMDSHPLVLGKRSAREAARAERDGAEWQRYPTPSIEASTQRNGAGMLRIDQPLWSGGRITAGIDAAGSRFDASGAALDEARQQLSLKAIAATSEALRQQARKQHGTTGVKEHEELLGMIKRRVAQEVSPLADQHLAESRLYAAANDLSAATQALNNALAQLAQLTGQPVTSVVEHGMNDVGMPVSLDEALTQALAYSPTLRRLVHEEESAIADIASKRSAYMPQLVFRLEGTTGGQVASSNRAMMMLLAQPGAGLSAKSGEDSAVARREAARMAREAAERDTREITTLDWNEWVAARQRLENANLARAMSAEVSDSYSRQYTAGRKTWIDVLNAVRETTLSEFNSDDARAQMLAASLRLRAMTGKLGNVQDAIR